MRSCSLPCVLGPRDVLALARGKNKTNSYLVRGDAAAKLESFKAVDFAHACEGAPDMGNGDGAADNESDVEGVDDLVALPAFFTATDQVVGDAIVAAENGAGDEAEEFFGLGAEGSGFVGLMVEREKALDAKVAAAEDLFIEVGAKFLEVVETVGHGCSCLRQAGRDGFCHRGRRVPRKSGGVPHPY